jgi:hypothetical protein
MGMFLGFIEITGTELSSPLHVDDRFPRRGGTIKAKARLVKLMTIILDINPYHVAVLIAMAQEAQHVRSKSKSRDQRAVLFRVSTLIPA